MKAGTHFHSSKHRMYIGCKLTQGSFYTSDSMMFYDIEKVECEQQVIYSKKYRAVEDQ